MPNYCINKLTLDGDNGAILEALPFILNDEEEIDFNITLPIPPELDYLSHLTDAGTYTFTRLPQEVYDKEGLPTEVRVSILKMMEDDFIMSNPVTAIVHKSRLAKLMSIDNVSWFDLNDDLLSNIERGVAICNSQQATPTPTDILNTLFDIHLQLYAIPYRISQHGAWRSKDWCEHHWGCGWNAIDTTLVGSGYEYIFSTPWAPPNIWFGDLAQKLWDAGIYINLKLAWCEPGAGFGGETHYTADGETAGMEYTESQMVEFLSEDAERLNDSASDAE